MEALANILKLIYKALNGFGVEKEFVFNFETFDGTEESCEINDTQVVEYEFVNLGTSLCIINNMPLYPVASGKEFHRIKLAIGTNEMDVSIYKYKFVPVDFFITTQMTYASEPAPAHIDYFQPNDGAGVDRGRTYISQDYNKLLVISKVKSNKRTTKSS